MKLKKKINIFVLSHNNYEELRLCIKSLISRTAYPHEIIIIDNASSEKNLINYLHYVESFHKISVVRNQLNLWAIGFNSGIKKFLEKNDEFFVATDSDIIVPIFKDNKCWLERMINEMDENIVIGKLGLSLDLGYIKNRHPFSNTYRKENSYFKNKKIGNNLIAPVDTTLAIYRTNYFMMNKVRFFPGHGVLNKPEYYCCRTNSNFLGKHIGWRNYLKTEVNAKQKISKVYCFTLLGAYLDSSFLKGVPYRYTLLYKFMRPFFRGLWALNVIVIQIFWIIKHLPFQLNLTQYKSKQTR